MLDELALKVSPSHGNMYSARTVQGPQKSTMAFKVSHASNEKAQCVV